MTSNMNLDHETAPELKLPGFRFHPTEEELLDFYLKNMVLGKYMLIHIITFLNIYHFDPWELPGKAEHSGEREWYFFVPRDRKHGSGGRPNRTTERGFWKATGSDRKIYSLSEPKRVVGLRKTLVFYKGRAPRGTKTDWVMNEYRLPDNCKLSKETVLCKVYRKATSLKVLEQRMLMEAEMRNFQSNASPSSPMDPSFSYIGPQDELAQLLGPHQMAQAQAQDQDQDQDQDQVVLKREDEEVEAQRSSPRGHREKLPEIQVPSKLGIIDWNAQDPLWMQLHSPWLQSFTAYNNILNF